jgi:hypothetical protein
MGAALHGHSHGLSIPAGQRSLLLSEAAIQLIDQTAEHPGPETDFVLPPWSSTGLSAPMGAPATSLLTSGAVPHLAASIAATLQHRADGTTEIALSPEELGAVRLRVEADANDPERVVIHLAFDRPETMDLFRRHADQLAEAIRAAGYAEARLDFGQAGAGSGDGHGQESAEGHGKAADALAAKADDPGFAPDRPFPFRPAGTAGLDLRL